MYTYQIKANNSVYFVKAKKAEAESLAAALRNLEKIHLFTRELTGVIGEKEYSHVFQSLFTPAGGTLQDPAGYEQDKAEFFASLPAEITDIQGTIEKAHALFQKHLPVKDKRITQEEAARRKAEEAARRKAEEAAAEEARLAKNAWLDAHCASRQPVEIPAGMMAVYLAITYDNSNPMTDYFDHHAQHGENMLLAIVKKQPQTERLARKVLSYYPELAALNWEWRTENSSMGHGNYLISEVAGTLEGITTYGGYSNPGFRYEIQFTAWRKSMYAYKNYPGSRPEAAAAEVYSAEGYTVEHERDWTWIKFIGKPAEPIREALKTRFSARFSGKRCAWYITRRVEVEEIKAAIG